MDQSLQDTKQRLQDALTHLQKDLSGIRAGRANPSLIEEIPVEAYGARMKMMEVGTIAAPQPAMLTIQVWDQSVVRAVEKAIMEANLGLNPSVDGQIVRLSFPPLTQERREEFVKMAHQKGEAGRIAIRQIRTEMRDDWKKQEEAGDIGEDDFHRLEKLLQEQVDRANAQVDDMVKAKQEELLEI